MITGLTIYLFRGEMALDDRDKMRQFSGVPFRSSHVKDALEQALVFLVELLVLKQGNI